MRPSPRGTTTGPGRTAAPLRGVSVGRDALAGRPTVLHALAFEAADEPSRRTLADRPKADDLESQADYLARTREIYRRNGAFDKAQGLILRYRRRAVALAREFEPQPVADLLAFLVGLVLGDSGEAGGTS